MDAKKAGLVTAGVLVALIAAAPLASATDKGDEGEPAAPQPTCSFVGGPASAASEITGESVAAAVAQSATGGNADGNIANCSEFLNDNEILNDNVRDNTIIIVVPAP